MNIFANNLVHKYLLLLDADINNAEDEILCFSEVSCLLSSSTKPSLPSELLKEIQNLNPYKTPRYDLIGEHILKQLPRKALLTIAC